jgi:hypothetical protein
MASNVGQFSVERSCCALCSGGSANVGWGCPIDAKRYCWTWSMGGPMVPPIETPADGAFGRKAARGTMVGSESILASGDE